MTSVAHGYLSPIPAAEYVRDVELMGKRRKEIFESRGFLMWGRSWPENQKT